MRRQVARRRRARRPAPRRALGQGAPPPRLHPRSRPPLSILPRMTLRVLLVPALLCAACSSTGGTGSSTGAGGADAGASGPPCSDARFATGRDSAQCEQLVDTEGRVIFLHGVNARVAGVFDVAFDDGRTALETLPAFTAA